MNFSYYREKVKNFEFWRQWEGYPGEFHPLASRLSGRRRFLWLNSVSSQEFFRREAACLRAKHAALREAQQRVGQAARAVFARGAETYRADRRGPYSFRLLLFSRRYPPWGG